MINVTELTKQYPMGSTIVHALRGVSFTVQQGEFVALMGPSGSGKSTLMHLLGCLDTPTSGSYELTGQDISTLSKRERAQVRNRQIGFVFQTFNLLARITAVENVKLPLLYEKGANSKAARQKSIAALERVGLADRITHKPSELSGGQRQRVAIARALVTNPAILLADEPTGNLDSKTGADILRLLTELNANGRTIIIVTHDPQVARQTERVLRMQDGLIDGVMG